jgi:hypothetical protein
MHRPVVHHLGGVITTAGQRLDLESQPIGAVALCAHLDDAGLHVIFEGGEPEVVGPDVGHFDGAVPGPAIFIVKRSPTAMAPTAPTSLTNGEKFSSTNTFGSRWIEAMRSSADNAASLTVTRYLR